MRIFDNLRLVPNQSKNDFANWRWINRRHLTLYSHPEFSWSARRKLAEEAENLFRKVCIMLHCSPDEVMARIALFREEASYRQWTGLPARTRAYTHYGWVYTWEGATSSTKELHCVLAHEFSHLCSIQRIARFPAAILEEGLAEYVAAELVPNADVPLGLCLPHTLRQLADKATYFEWMSDQPTPYTYQYKTAHAHAFIRYLVNWGGMSRMLLLCHHTGINNDFTAPERLERAAQQVYGISLAALEQQWRIATSCSLLPSQTNAILMTSAVINSQRSLA